MLTILCMLLVAVAPAAAVTLDLNLSKGSAKFLVALPHGASGQRVLRPLGTLYQPAAQSLKFVFIVPSYNNAQWYEQNLGSLFAQQYDNYRVIYVDDASTDGTPDLVEAFAKKCGKSHKIKLIRNKERMGMAYNRYLAVHQCEPTEICLAYDGDDWMPHDQVLNFYNAVYQDRNVWMTYGQYRTYPEGKLGCCKQLPLKTILSNGFRDHAWVTSHFRTFYAWLFQAIDIGDFKCRDKFITASTDLAMMFPMLEMAGPYSKFVREITYIYNKANPLLLEANKKASAHAYDMRKAILRKKRYEPIAVVQDKRDKQKTV